MFSSSHAEALEALEDSSVPSRTRGLRALRPPLAESRWRDAAFETIFARVLVYTILFEDNEKDLKLLALRPGDRVLTVAGAGCGVAAMLSGAPEVIDAVDFNVKHLAVTALKVSAATRLRSREEIHQLFARGSHPHAEPLVRRLAEPMPRRLADFWRSGWRMFVDDFYAHGFYTKNRRLVQRFWPITDELLRELAPLPAEERSRRMRALLTRTMKRGVLGALIRSPASLLGAGINYTQRARNLRAVGAEDVVDGVIDFASRIAQTNLEENWILWHIATGRFNPDHERCVPVDLRPEVHARTVGAPTQVRYHHGRLLDVLHAAPSDSWTHVCLSDVVDWIPDSARGVLLGEVHRVAKPGAKVICRTVEESTIVDQLGLEGSFRLLEPCSTRASAAERSRLYRRVNYYEVVK